jgi:hypothetical protein
MKSIPSFRNLIAAYDHAFLEQVLVSAACNGAHSLEPGGKLREQGTAARANGFWNVWCHGTVRYETRRYPWRRQQLIPITG